MGRIKEINRRTSKRRKRNPIVYIICEGTETEIRYFKKFRSRGCKIDIIPLSSQYKAADALVKKVKATIGTNDYFPEDGDIVWCVFDRDDNNNQMLSRAKQIAKKEGYKIAFSNPCFEIWFLYHFLDQGTEIADCNAAIRLLKQKGKLEKYEKNKDVYEELKGLQGVAIQRAKKRVTSLEKQRIEIVSRQSNPVTTVYELVEYLLSYTKHNG